jgi:PAS domain-containing protein
MERAGGEEPRVEQRPIELILARQLAAALAVPVLLVDERGDTLFFNEPAELIIARRFDEIDDLTFEQRAAILAPRDEGGRSVPPEQLPGMVAMRERTAAHGQFHVHGYDGVLRAVEATAIPIESAGGHMLGAMVILWQRPDREGLVDSAAESG